MNTQAPPDGNTTVAPRLVIISSILLSIALVVYSLRIYTHMRPVYKLAGDDYIISLTVAIEIAVFSLMVASCYHGLGRHQFYITPEETERAMLCLFGVMILGLWAATLARVSVAYMLLRLNSSRIWRVTIYVVITIQLAAVIGTNLCQFLQCTPLRTMWAVVPDTKCWSPFHIQLYGYFFAGISIVCDLFIALMPMSFIWTLSRPFLERMLLAMLMALGLCATAVAALKIYHMSSFDLMGDFLRTVVEMALLSRVEELVLITAACMPFLKSPTENLLRRFNVRVFEGRMRSLNTIVVTDSCTSPTKVNSKTSGTTLTEAGSKASESEFGKYGKDIIRYSNHERVGAVV